MKCAWCKKKMNRNEHGWYCECGYKHTKKCSCGKTMTLKPDDAKVLFWWCKCGLVELAKIPSETLKNAPRLNANKGGGR